MSWFTTSFPIFLLLFGFLSSSAQTIPSIEPTDSVTTLEELSVEGTTRRLIEQPQLGKSSLNVDALGKVMRMFGEADPLNYAVMAGGVTPGSDYSSGLNVQGAGFSQSLYKVGESTVYFPYHFGGIFSMFNGWHFPSLTIEKGFGNLTSASRLGAVFNINSRTWHPDRIRGSINLGMTASSLGLSIPFSKNFSIDLSGRISYLDKLYGPLLDLKDQTIKYSFGETALTARWNPTSVDRIKLDFVFNSDHLNVLDNHFELDTYLDWRNIATSLEWRHNGKNPFRVWGTWSGFDSKLNATMPGFIVDIPSDIKEAKIGGEVTIPDNQHSGKWIIGGEAIYYEADPQRVGSSSRIEALEARIYAEWEKNLTERFSLASAIRGSIYTTPDYTTGLPAPSITLKYDDGNNKAGINFSVTPQYLHQIGFADIGLASNFWFPATKYARGQLAAGFTLSYICTLLDGDLSIGIEPYWRRILHETEYSGILLDLIDRAYNLPDHIITSNGFNTGVDLNVNYSHGPFTAIANYSIGIARRRFPGAEDRYLPAMSEGLNSLNILFSYRPNNHWTFGANFRLASGRCYTPVKALYMLGENVMMVYGNRNSARLPLYHRLDLSAAYSFNTGGRLPLEHSVVLSIINAYGRKNIELSSYRFSSEMDTFYLHQVPSLYRFLPSLSYTLTL